MELLAIDLGVESFLYLLEACLQVGILQVEARKLITTTIAFLIIPKNLWHFTRNNNNPSQQYHLTQIPYDIVVDNMTRYALTYQISLHFEKPIQAYTSKEVVEIIM